MNGLFQGLGEPDPPPPREPDPGPLALDPAAEAAPPRYVLGRHPQTGLPVRSRRERPAFLAAGELARARERLVFRLDDFDLATPEGRDAYRRVYQGHMDQTMQVVRRVDLPGGRVVQLEWVEGYIDADGAAER